MPLRMLYITALLWLALPMMLFLGSWPVPWLGWPLVGLLTATIIWLRCTGGHGVSPWCNLGSSQKLPSPDVPRRPAVATESIPLNRTTLTVMLLTAALTVCSGVGGFFFQMEWDHQFRNEIFNQLVNNPWPVINNDLPQPRMLTYYIAFWLPPAAVAKLTGSMLAGNIAQLLYAYIGLQTAVLLLLHGIRRHRLRAWWTWVLFAPLYMPAAAALTVGQYPDFVCSQQFLWENNDLCTLYFSAPPLSIMLFWIYNQGIAAWLGLTLLYRLRHRPEVMMLVYGLLVFFSPVTCLGIMPVVAWWLLKHLRASLTVANAAGLLLAALSALYFGANGSQRRLVFEDTSVVEYLCMMLLFVVIAYGVYMPWMWRQLRHDRLWWALLAWSLLLPMLRIGNDYDLGWRAAIPTMCYFTYRIMQRVAETDWRSRRAWLFGAVLLIGAVGNFTYVRAIRGEYRHLRYGTPRRSDTLHNQLWNPTQNPCYTNFIGTPPAWIR